MSKVLVFVPMCGRGGVALVVRKLLQGLVDTAPKGWRFDILGQTYDENGVLVKYPRKMTFDQIRPMRRLPTHPKLFSFLLANSPVFVQHLQEKVKTSKPDVIFCPSSWWVIRNRDWNLSVPYVTCIPDFAFDTIDMGHMLTEHFRYASGLIRDRVDMTVFSSETQRTHAVKKYQFEPCKTRVIHHSADFVAEGFDPSPEEAERVKVRHGLPEKYLLAFHPMGHKDPATLLRGFALARRSSKIIPPLVIAGIETEQLCDEQTRNPQVRELRLIMKQNELYFGRDLYVLGTVPEGDIAGLFAGAMASISTSRSEGDIAGGTFASFMAKCPHVWSDLAVYREQLKDTMGWMFPVGQYEVLAETLERVCRYRDDAKLRALAAYDWAQQRTVKDVAQDYLDVFTEVMR